jgi:hypothetical protein
MADLSREQVIARIEQMLGYSAQRVVVYNRKLREWAIPGCTVSPETIKADTQARDAYQAQVDALDACLILLRRPQEQHIKPIMCINCGHEMEYLVQPLPSLPSDSEAI